MRRARLVAADQVRQASARADLLEQHAPIVRRSARGMQQVRVALLALARAARRVGGARDAQLGGVVGRAEPVVGGERGVGLGAMRARRARSPGCAADPDRAARARGPVVAAASAPASSPTEPRQRASITHARGVAAARARRAPAPARPRRPSATRASARRRRSRRAPAGPAPARSSARACGDQRERVVDAALLRRDPARAGRATIALRACRRAPRRARASSTARASSSRSLTVADERHAVLVHRAPTPGARGDASRRRRARRASRRSA